MASTSTSAASTSSSKIADPKLEPVLDDEPVDLSDIERILAADATNVQREEEVRERFFKPIDRYCRRTKRWPGILYTGQPYLDCVQAESL